MAGFGSSGSVALDLSPRTSKRRPPRIVLNAVEGWGKTTVAAHAENPVILQMRGESGYDTLLSAGLVPSVPVIDISGFEELVATVDALAAKPEDRRTLTIDAMGGAERLCHERVCLRDYNNDWGEKGFMGFRRGAETSVSDWIRLLAALDRANEAGLAILLLSHAKVVTFKNPEGPDFDRYAADVDTRTWSPTHRWADAVLFGKFVTIVESQKRGNAKAKGIGGTDRIVYTERRDAYDAKNRYAMDPELWIKPDEVGPADMWNVIAKAMTKNLEVADVT